MTISKWCEVNGIPVSQYYYWNRRVHQAQDIEGSSEIAFVDIASLLTSKKKTRQRIHTPSEFLSTANENSPFLAIENSPTRIIHPALHGVEYQLSSFP